MDNVTHTLLGLAAAEAVAQGRRKPRLPLWIVSAVANNLPDTDVLLTTFVLPGKLNYLLHHRGHTHTLLLAPLFSLLLLLAALYATRKQTSAPKAEMAFLAFLGVPLHLFADYWNSYGVHPFWPISSDWIYGDMVFIVEPWIWATLLPLIFWAAGRIGRAISGALLVGILALAWYHSYVPWPAAAALTIWAAAVFAGLPRLSAPKRVLVALGCTAFLLALLAGLSHRVKTAVHQPGSETALSPSPANPFCWMVIQVADTNPSRTVTYEATLSNFAPFPALYPATACPSPLAGHTAPLVPLDSPNPERRLYLGAFRAPLAELQALRHDCQVAALLRFARAPFWLRKDGAWLVGDLRYDREPGLGFAEFLFRDGDPCPKHEPPWRGRFHPELANSDPTPW